MQYNELSVKEDHYTADNMNSTKVQNPRRNSVQARSAVRSYTAHARMMPRRQAVAYLAGFMPVCTSS